MSPSTEWKEVIAPGEGAVFEQLAQDLAGVQARIAAKRGPTQRALHAKANVLVRAEFEVLAGIPEHARVGLYAEPKKYDAVVRFSNGGASPQADKKPDVRGVAVKVIGVGGKKLIPGMETALTQDFLAILTPAQPFATPEDFVWFVVNAQRPLTLLPKALFRMGPKIFPLLSKLQKGLGAPLTALHTNRYFSALPIQFGKYAAKYSFVPLEVEGASGPVDPDLGGALVKLLETRPLRWELQMQFFTNEQSTPLEDSTVEWTAPWTPVARLTLPQQAVNSEQGKAFSTWAEPLSFDPWHAQEEFKPLGAMMRARNAAYRVSTIARKASPEPTSLPWVSRRQLELRFRRHAQLERSRPAREVDHADGASVRIHAEPAEIEAQTPASAAIVRSASRLSVLLEEPLTGGQRNHRPVVANGEHHTFALANALEPQSPTRRRVAKGVARDVLERAHEQPLVGVDHHIRRVEFHRDAAAAGLR